MITRKRYESKSKEKQFLFLKIPVFTRQEITVFLLLLLCFILMIIFREPFYLRIDLAKQWNIFASNVGLISLDHQQIQHHTNSEKISSLSQFEHDSIAIVGMVKDAQHTIGGLMAQIDTFACNFDTAVVLIFESNSKDNTPTILEQWTQTPVKCSETDNMTREPKIIKKLLKPSIDPARKYANHDRLDRYVFYRNYLMDETEKYADILASNTGTKFNFDYWMVVDLDVRGFDTFALANELYNAKQFKDEKNEQFVGMCANGVHHSGWYYDSFATVLPDGDWFWTRNRVFRSNMLQQQRFTPAVSCFGGLAVYNYQNIVKSKCKYELFDENIEAKWTNVVDMKKLADMYNEETGTRAVCEHVPFHACLLDSSKQNSTLVVARDAMVYYGDV